ncbi:MAG: PH domain-containing protein [Anaerovibrio sp.]|nr:PH domain-containing protein [Anaerovibrio sp.]
MGLLDGLLGNASEINAEEIRAKYSMLLVSGEKINQAYKVVRDMFLFTDRRLILVDVQGLTGKKVEYHSIPYDKITHFSIESAGNFDMEAELKIWISGMGPNPIEKTFGRNDSVYKIQSLLAEYVMR